MTTTDVAKQLGVSSEFIRGEIRDGRLQAIVVKHPGRRRAVIRVTPAQFAEYQETVWRPTVPRGTNNQPNQSSQ